jgi:CRP-like cAMP-binding protein
LGPGQYFGEMQLLYGKGRSASARASELSPAEVYSVDFQTLSQILGESESLREAMTQTANERMAHNRVMLGD